jgi:hypothetical protein
MADAGTYTVTATSDWTSATTNYVTLDFSPWTISGETVSREETALEWLDRRVEEMRVAL